MGLNLDIIEETGAPISFLKTNEVKVLVGPCSSQSWIQKKIPLDGRHYKCSGTIILKSGKRLQANFEINTHTFDFLERDSVLVYSAPHRTWYYINETELHNILNLSYDEIFPYKWETDIPLDYYQKAPYPMEWPEI